MGCLSRLSVTSRARTLVRYVFGFIVLLAGVLCVSLAVLQAAPVTLHFEATIGPPRQGLDGLVPPGWNISLVETKVRNKGVRNRIVQKCVPFCPTIRPLAIDARLEFLKSDVSTKMAG